MAWPSSIPGEKSRVGGPTVQSQGKIRAAPGGMSAIRENPDRQRVIPYGFLWTISYAWTRTRPKRLVLEGEMPIALLNRSVFRKASKHGACPASQRKLHIPRMGLEGIQQ